MLICRDYRNQSFALPIHFANFRLLIIIIIIIIIVIIIIII